MTIEPGFSHPTSVSAAGKLACAACGAHAEWSPAKLKLVCVACGTESPGELDTATGEIREIDLVAAMRDMPEELRGWQDDKKSVRCLSCNAVSVFDVARVGQQCDFCGAPSLIPYEEIRAPIRPHGLLPFTIPESQIREQLRQWYAKQPLAPNALVNRGLVDRIKGVYVPYWTFDAKVRCWWEADAGYYMDRGSEPRQRRDREVRWEPAKGMVDHFFDDLLIPATKGVRADLLSRIEPWPIKELVPYSRGYLSGFTVEHYQVVPFDAAQAVRKDMDRIMKNTCELEVPGDTCRSLTIASEYSAETFKLILVPVWLLSYTYRGKPFQIVANGCTGTIQGDSPWSFWKVFFVVALILVVFGFTFAKLLSLYFAIR
jgi:hypothetical protein